MPFGLPGVTLLFSGEAGRGAAGAAPVVVPGAVLSDPLADGAGAFCAVVDGGGLKAVLVDEPFSP